MEAYDQVEERWCKLDPIFIMGMQRSGTTAMARATKLCGFTHFAEGHLWFELMKPLGLFRNPNYRVTMRRPGWTLGDGRDLVIEQYVALAIDQFHRDHLPEKGMRWVDKSPGPRAVKVAPILAQAFPRSQFIFMAREATATIHSGMKLWSESRSDKFEKLCVAWTDVMATWRKVRRKLEGRYLEIRQEDLAAHPEDVAAQLTDFLGVPDRKEKVADLFSAKRVNTAFPDKAPGDYDYDLGWSNRQKAFFIQACSKEMERWDYPIPFPVNPLWEWRRRLVMVSDLISRGKFDKLWNRTRQYIRWRLDLKEQ